MSYLRTIVRTGSRPINPARGNRTRQALTNIEPVAETAMHGLFPSGEAPRLFPHADRRHDPQEIHDVSAPAAEESVAQLGATGEAATLDDHRSLMPQDSVVVTKAFSDPSPLTPTAQDTTRSSLPAVPDNDFPDLRGAASHPVQQANQDAPHAGNALAGSTAPESITDALSVTLQSPGRSGRVEGQDHGNQEILAVAMPPAPKQPFSLRVQETVQRGPARGAASAPEPGMDSPDSAIPPHSTDSEPCSSPPEGGPRSLQPQKVVQDTHTDLAVFYVTPRQVAPEAAAMPKASLRNSNSDGSQRSTASLPTADKAERPAEMLIVQPKAAADNAQVMPSPGTDVGYKSEGSMNHGFGNEHMSAAEPGRTVPVLPSRPTPELPPREPLAARPQEQMQLPPAAGMGSSRRDESGPRLLIHRLDVQIITQKQPEPPRQAPPSLPAVAARDAWEGVDRHYLHHIYVSA